jgi:gamma-glutamyltranspeptidase/glutathione hydrolase
LPWHVPGTPLDADHITLHVHNLTRSLTFYREVLGLPQVRRPDFPFPGAWFSLGERGRTLHLVERAAPVFSAIHGTHVAIRVPDLLGLRLVLGRTHHANVTVGPVRPDGGNQIYLPDPDGHVWEFLQLPTAAAPPTPITLQLLAEQLDPHQDAVAAQYDEAERRGVAEASATAAQAAKSASNSHASVPRVPSGAVAAGNPLAAEEARRVLAAGGSAIDAAIAANLVLAVVEPMNCGLGGDLFALVAEPAAPSPSTTPAAQHENPPLTPAPQPPPLLLGLEGAGRSPLRQTQTELRSAIARLGYATRWPTMARAFPVPRHGALSVTVPGAAKAMCDLHARYGRLPWERLFETAVRLSYDGFEVSLHTAKNWQHVARAREAHATGLLDDAGYRDFLGIYAPLGVPPRPGERFHNPSLAYTLQALARGGCDAFYRGPVAKEMVAYLQQRGSRLAADDFAAHRSTWTPTRHVSYRGERAQVHALPPTGQGEATLALLQVLDRLQPPARDAGPDERARWVHHGVSAKRLVYTGLRAGQLGEGTAPPFGQSVADALHAAGEPWKPPAGFDAQALADAVGRAYEAGQAMTGAVGTAAGTALPPDADTVAMSVADASGLAVALLQSNGLPFGAGLASPRLGFAFQNRGSLFALDAPPAPAGSNPRTAHPNLYGPGRRPFHTLTPFAVLKPDGGILLAAMKGGDRQPYAFAQVLSRMVDGDIPLGAAVTAARWRNTDAESRSPWLPASLAAAGADWRLVEFDVGGGIGDDDAAAERRALEDRGYQVRMVNARATGTPFEDSGFGVLQAVAQEPWDADSGKVWSAYADTTRKPGRAFPVLSAPHGGGRAEGVFVGKWPSVCVVAIPNNAWTLHVRAVAGPKLRIVTPSGMSLANGIDLREALKKMLHRCPPSSVLLVFLSNAHEMKAMRAEEWGVPSVLPPLGLMDLLGDKQRLAAWMTKDPVLRHHVLQTYDARTGPGMSDSVAFPCVVKAPRGSNGVTVRIARSAAEMEDAIAELLAISPGHVRGDILLQEAVLSRQELTINFLALRGQVQALHCVSFVYASDLFVKRNSGEADGRLFKSVEPCAGPLFEDGADVVRRLVAVSGYHGIGCLQYKRPPGPGARLKVIEVNPRPCGSLIMDNEALARWIHIMAFSQPVTVSDVT